MKFNLFFCSLFLIGFSKVDLANAYVALEKPSIPSNNPMSEEKIELGKFLYFDKRLSLDGTVSCNTCHDVTKGKYGVDGLATSKGIKNQFGGRNAPTVLNAAYLSVQFWDGRAKDLEEQALGPITNPIEMGMPNHDVAVDALKKIPEYEKKFKKVFGTGVTKEGISLAIAAFERTLVTMDSPFDRWVKGDPNAISAQAKNGAKLFETSGCIACHSGAAFAGPALPVGVGFYQKFPTIEDAEIEKKYNFKSDLGRMEVTKNESDRNQFRVPTLRNIEKTGPYFHNGKVSELKEAIRIMAKTQLGKDLKQEEISDIEAFLKTLTGKSPDIAEPKML